LVTDLPADFDVALQGVDTRLKALNPATTLGDITYASATANTNTRLGVGTNGQVLAVVAGVPAWQNGTTGDIEGVTAGVGISGGGTSGTVTVTNSMATAITTAGDLIKGTGSGTFDRLGIGSTSQVLTVVSGAPAWVTPAGGGKVLQVVQGTLTSTFTTTSGSMVDTGLTASITPSSATSKIYVTYSANTACTVTGSSANNYALLRLMADATQVQGLSFGYYALASSSSPEMYIPTALSYLHSPATTSSVTYKIQMRVASATTARMNASSTETASIVLMEIGA
jgi:hypothetical protein